MLRSHPFVSKKHELCSYESSPSNNSLEEQDTIILHDELPKSIWEKGSFPQTEQKELESPQRQFNSTVVINEDSSEISLFSNFKKALEDECLSSAKPKAPKHKENILPNNVNLDHLNQIRMGVA